MEGHRLNQEQLRRSELRKGQESSRQSHPGSAFQKEHYSLAFTRAACSSSGVYGRVRPLGGGAGPGDSLLQHRLPFAKPGTDGEAVDSALDLGTPLPHVVLNVKQEGLLPKVGVHNLPRCLQAYGGVEVGLRRRMKCQSGPEGKRGQQGLVSSHPCTEQGSASSCRPLLRL